MAWSGDKNGLAMADAGIAAPEHVPYAARRNDRDNNRDTGQIRDIPPP